MVRVVLRKITYLCVYKDKLVYMCILFIHDLFLFFSIFLGYATHLQGFSNSHKSPKECSNVFIEKNPCISRTMQFKAVWFKRQLHLLHVRNCRVSRCFVFLRFNACCLKNPEFLTWHSGNKSNWEP